MEAVPAPRMTKGQLGLLHADDRLLNKEQLQVKRRIQRYNSFKNSITLLANLAKFKMQETQHIVIGFKTDKQERIGKPHQQVPDSDNLLKAIKDALCKTDAHIWDERITKIWSEVNFITIQPI